MEREEERRRTLRDPVLPEWKTFPPCEGDIISFDADIDGCIERLCASGKTVAFPPPSSLQTYLKAVGCYRVESFKSAGGLELRTSRLELSDRLWRGSVAAFEAQRAHNSFEIWWIGFNGETVVHLGGGHGGVRFCTKETAPDVFEGFAFIWDDTGYKSQTKSRVRLKKGC